MTCPICGSENNVNIIGILEYTLFDDSPLSKNVDVTNCSNCGFVRYNPLSLQKNYIQYKNTDIFDDPSSSKYSHVLEHIVDLNFILTNVRSRLKKDEKIYIEVPDADRYDWNENINPIRYFYLSHISHFDKIHLRNLLYSNSFKEIESGYCMHKEGDLEIPSIWSIYAKVDDLRKKAITHDFTLANKIKKWFNELPFGIIPDTVLTELALFDKHIYIWGLGIHAQMMLGMSPLKYCNNIIYIDSNKEIQEKTINSKKIYSSDAISPSDNDTVIIGSPTHSKEIYKQLREEMDFKGQVIKIGFGNTSIC